MVRNSLNGIRLCTPESSDQLLLSSYMGHQGRRQGREEEKGTWTANIFFYRSQQLDPFFLSFILTCVLRLFTPPFFSFTMGLPGYIERAFYEPISHRTDDGPEEPREMRKRAGVRLGADHALSRVAVAVDV